MSKLQAISPYVVDTTTLLGVGGMYTSPVLDVTGYRVVSFFSFADQDSATSGVLMQWSVDGTNWDLSEPLSFTTAAGALAYHHQPKARFFRVSYVNGGTAQTVFRAQIMAKP